MRRDHKATQASLAAAIRDATAATPPFITAANRRRARSGLNVYRNNVAASLLAVLAARFPVVRALAGDESFFNAGRAFLAAHPPRSPVLMGYGEGFPEFVKKLGSAGCFRYLADIAQLELARGRSYHAADMEPVTAEQFAAIPAEHLGELRIELHPSVSLLSSRFPIVSVWQAHQADRPVETALRAWGAEAALIARPFLEVHVRRLPPGGFAFLTALASGLTLSDAVGKAIETAGDFNLPLNLSILIEACIVTAFRR